MIDLAVSHAAAAAGGFTAACLLGFLAGTFRRPPVAPEAPATPEPVAESDSAAVAVAARMRRYVHEINNILTAISGYAELARRRPVEDAEATACIDQIVLGIQRATVVSRRLRSVVQQEGAKECGPASRHAGTVLVVDDEETVRDAAALTLLDHGFAVHRAADGAEALALIDAAPEAFDLVLTDVMMPGMTGPDLARRLAEQHPGVAVVYMSGYENRRLANERMIGRGDQCVAKPFTSDGLVTAIGTALAARRATAPAMRPARVA